MDKRSVCTYTIIAKQDTTSKNTYMRILMRGEDLMQFTRKIIRTLLPSWQLRDGIFTVVMIGVIHSTRCRHSSRRLWCTCSLRRRQTSSSAGWMIPTVMAAMPPTLLIMVPLLSFAHGLHSLEFLNLAS